MFNIQIFTVGKHKESWLNAALSEYEKRLKSHFRFTWKFFKNDQDLIAAINKESSLICLDSKGISFTSEEFSLRFFQQIEKHGSKLNFVIGRAEGIPKQVFQKADQAWSFSRLTFTHQQIRLILMEQIYRAFEIRKGSGYHKSGSSFDESC